jgi:hypothetical protein
VSCQTSAYIDRVVNDVLLNIPQIPEKLIKNTFYNVLDDFFISTNRWRYVFTEFAISEDNTTYSIPNKDNAEIIKVIDLFYTENGTEYKINERKDVWRNNDTYSYYQPEPRVIILNTPIKNITELRANVSLKLTRDSETLPDLLELYFNGIVAGILYKLLLIPNKEWTNGDLATFHYKVYDEAKKEALRFHNLNMLNGRPLQEQI